MVVNLFVDGVVERLDAGMPREAVCATGGTTRRAERSGSTGPGTEGGHGELYGYLRRP